MGMQDSAGPATASDLADKLETVNVSFGSVFVGEGARDDGRPSGYRYSKRPLLDRFESS
jgi:hypothetical protein